MQIKFSKLAATIFAAMIFTGATFAHPGHAPTDPVAQISEPLAGVDHFAAFVALSAILLLVLRGLVKRRSAVVERVRSK